MNYKYPVWLFAILIFPVASLVAEAHRPNVLDFLVDNMSADDLVSYAREFHETPHYQTWIERERVLLPEALKAEVDPQAVRPNPDCGLPSLTGGSRDFLICNYGQHPSDGDIQIHQILSPYQAHKTQLRILLPDELEQSRKYRVLYVLPVHEDGVEKHGDGLLEIQKLGYHNQHQLICVAPGYTSKPWYADHDLDPHKQDESHLLKTVIPFVEKRYPVRTDVKGRLLIGFSKSGWGAATLLLRHPDVFHRAAAWDSGILVDTGLIDEAERQERIAREWGSPENFEAHRLSSLIKTRGKALGDQARLFFFCTEGKRALASVEIHRLLVENKIPHRYVMEPRRDHRWDSGWIPEAMTFLLGPEAEQ